MSRRIIIRLDCTDYQQTLLLQAEGDDADVPPALPVSAVTQPVTLVSKPPREVGRRRTLIATDDGSGAKQFLRTYRGLTRSHPSSPPPLPAVLFIDGRSSPTRPGRFCHRTRSRSQGHGRWPSARRGVVSMPLGCVRCGEAGATPCDCVVVHTCPLPPPFSRPLSQSTCQPGALPEKGHAAGDQATVG